MKCRPWKAWFWCPLSSENAVGTFPDLLEMLSTWYPNGLQIGAGGCLWDQKIGKSGAWKTSQKHVTKKHWDLFKNGPKRGSRKSDFFVVFQGSIPAWSLGCPWGGSRAQKHVKMEAQTHILYDFRKMFSRYLETLWKYFVCSLKNKLIVFDVNLLFSLLRLGGKTYGGCLPDASQMLPRCLPNPSLLHDSFSVIPLPMIPPPWFLVTDFSSMILGID